MLLSGIAAACDWGDFVTTATGLVCASVFQKTIRPVLKSVRAATPREKPCSVRFLAGTVVIALVAAGQAATAAQPLRPIAAAAPDPWPDMRR